jgi:hypothetical protein
MIPRTCLVLFWVGISALCCRAGRTELNFSTALPVQKRAEDTVIRRNPFQASGEPDRPLPVSRDKDDPTLRLPSVLTSHIRSVLREPRPLVLVDENVFQPGDEVRLSTGELVPKYRVILKSVDADRLAFLLVSQDPQQPGQIEVSVQLAPAMRRN